MRASIRGSATRVRAYDVPMRSYLAASRRFTAASRSNATISMAVAAASSPLWPSLPPRRSNACSRVFTVRTPKTTGTPVSSATREIPAAHSPATYSKCGVSPRTTAPMQMTASVAPDRASFRATSGSSNAPGTHTTSTCAASYFSRVRCAPSRSASVMSRLNRATAIAMRMPVASSSPSKPPYSPTGQLVPSCSSSSRSRRWPILRCLARRYAMFSFVGTVCSGTRSTISSP